MGWLTDLLKEIPSTALYKSKLEQLASEHAILKSENRDLQAKLVEAQKRIEQLEKCLHSGRRPQVVMKKPRP